MPHIGPKKVWEGMGALRHDLENQFQGKVKSGQLGSHVDGARYLNNQGRGHVGELA